METVCSSVMVAIAYEYQNIRRHTSENDSHYVSRRDKFRSDDMKHYYNKLLQRHLSLQI
jgi:hypothetical protein